jgi:glycosyltransferase involved in cell wall biosynthesis
MMNLSRRIQLDPRQVSDPIVSSVPTPKVSIGMPVYNSEEYLREAIDSLCAQNFREFELIISDDGSTDCTEAICRDYEASDSRIRYIRRPCNLGMAVNYNFLLQEATGQYFMWAAHDDRWDKEFLATLVRALDLNADCTSAFCPYIYVDETGRALSPVPIRCDYSGRTAFQRLTKFCRDYNDAFFYGLHRRESVLQARVPVWWWFNSRTPVNCNYPVLVFFLSTGQFVLTGHAPLWFNRLKPAPYTVSPFPTQRVRNFLAFVLRKTNVFYESVVAVYVGTSSAQTTLAVIPVLLSRCLYDIVTSIMSQGRVGLGRLRRRIRRNQTTA